MTWEEFEAYMWKVRYLQRTGETRRKLMARGQTIWTPTPRDHLSLRWSESGGRPALSRSLDFELVAKGKEAAHKFDKMAVGGARNLKLLPSHLS